MFEAKSTIKYPNIKALQEKYNLTNDLVAACIGVCRSAYGKKLRRGGFDVEEAKKLMLLFHCKDFEYLFMTK